MFRRNRDRRVHMQARTIANLQQQVESLRAQLVAASAEFDRRYAELLSDRDYWRKLAQAKP